MCVLVPIKQAPAFRNVDDIDAKNMGLDEEEQRRFNEPAEEQRKRTELRATEVAHFRAERREVRKAQAAGDKRAPGAGLVLKPSKAEKRALPSFMRVRAGQEEATAVPSTSADGAQPSEKRPCAATGDHASSSGGAAAQPAEAEDDSEEELQVQSSAGGAPAPSAVAAMAPPAFGGGAAPATVASGGGLGLGEYDSNDEE